MSESCLGQGAAPGKAILLGEHFVVYGSPAIAVPLPRLQLVARVRAAMPGEPRAQGHLEACLGIVLGSLGGEAGAVVAEVESSIPVGSGMGSSAALSVALARAGAAAAGLGLDLDRDRDLSMRCERLAHGRPSGIDTEVCVTGQPVWSEDGRFTAIGADSAQGVGLVVLYAGRGGDTSEMVARVARYREAQPARFEALALATTDRCHEARGWLEGGHGRPPGPMAPDSLARLGEILCEQHRDLQELGVSTPELDRVVAAACEDGAAGAKLSGAGGGGAVVALAALGSTARLAQRLAARGLEVVTWGPLL